MRLESARDLKQELLAKIVMPLSVTGQSRAAMTHEASGTAAELAVGARALDRVPAIPRSIALGIAHDGKQYKLAVRIQRQGLMGSTLLEEIVRHAKGEVDVRLIGRIAKRPARGKAQASQSNSRVSAKAAPWYRDNARPLLIGASVGHVDITAGTIGAFVKRGKRVYILSNNHVLANEDAGQAGEAVLQRGVADGGRAAKDRAGALRHWIRLKRRGANLVDAALAEIDAGIDHDPGLLRGLAGRANQRLAGLGSDFLDEGVIVHKVGRTTGATKGRVTAFDVDNVVISYDLGNLRFDGQVEIEGTGNRAFSDGGDSGSLIVDSDMRAVALLFAGGDVGGSNGLGLTYANPIHAVLKHLRTTLRS